MTNEMTIKQLGFCTDNGAGERARIGLLVLGSDQTMEWEMRMMTHLPGVSFYHSRLANDVLVTPKNLTKMESELPLAAELLPSYLKLSALGYGCTSGATFIGEARVREILQDTHLGVPVTDPLTAAKAAFNAMGVHRIGLVTPYTANVTKAMQKRFDAANIKINIIGSFYEENDEIVGRIEKASILDAAISLGRSDEVDGIFISCTSLRAAEIIEQAEETLGKPVTASNHALAWHLLRLAGISDELDGFGSLFKLQAIKTRV